MLIPFIHAFFEYKKHIFSYDIRGNYHLGTRITKACVNCTLGQQVAKSSLNSRPLYYNSPSGTSV